MGDKRKYVARILHRIARLSLVTFCIGIGGGCTGGVVLSLILNLREDNVLVIIFGTLILLLTLLPGIVYIVSVFARDAIALGAIPWQISAAPY
jgi:hypothetical protein